MLVKQDGQDHGKSRELNEVNVQVNMHNCKQKRKVANAESWTHMKNEDCYYNVWFCFVFIHHWGFLCVSTHNSFRQVMILLIKIYCTTCDSCNLQSLWLFAITVLVWE